MKEIKFRLWTGKRMTKPFCLGYEYYTADDNGVHYSTIKKQTYHTPKDAFVSFCLAEEGVLLQYTGLKDKNGKEIYEGDIVKPTLCRKGVVEWNNRTSEYLIRTMNGGWTKIDDLEDDEIIGNIYENPELLEE